MRQYVDVDGLNLRSGPQRSAHNRLAILHLGQAIESLGPAEVEGWTQVSAEVEGQRLQGYSATRFLRDPVGGAREALIAAGIREWLRFEKGLGHETVAPFHRYVGEMWRAIGLELDGRDADQPWSAAAMSFFVRHAAEQFPRYRRFRFAAAHARFIHDAITRRLANDHETPFWGFRLHERRPQLGDLVCRWREVPVDFERALHRDDYKSHTDVIVHVGPDAVLALGGNVHDSVALTSYHKTGSGFLAGSSNVFALLANVVE
jgi:hypothetical protein